VTTLASFYALAAQAPIQYRRWCVGAAYTIQERAGWGESIASARNRVMSLPQYSMALVAAGLDDDLALVDSISGGGPPPTTPPTVVGAGTPGLGTTTDGSLSPGLPAGFQANDIGLLSVVSVPGDGAVVIPAGWTTVVDVTLVRELTVAWRRLQGGDTAPTVTKPALNGWTAQIVGYRGVRATGNPWDVAPVTNTGSGVATVTITGGITPTSDNNRIVMIAGRAGGGTISFSGWNTTNPGALTEDFDLAALNGQGGASAAQATAAPTGDATTTESATQAWQAALFALVPA